MIDEVVYGMLVEVLVECGGRMLGVELLGWIVNVVIVGWVSCDKEVCVCVEDEGCRSVREMLV